MILLWLLLFLILLTFVAIGVRYGIDPNRITTASRCGEILFQSILINAATCYGKKLPSKENRTVVSFTTTPTRIEHILPTVYTLVTQTYRVDEIRLNVPYYSQKTGTAYEIPDILKTLEYVSGGVFRIYRTWKDYGPSTKLLPALVNEPIDSRIIVVDDDGIYGECLFGNLVAAFEENCGKSAITTYGKIYSTSPRACNRSIRDHVCDFFEKTLFETCYKKVDVLMGFSGYIVTPRMFGTQIFTPDDAPKCVFNADDDWISGCLNSGGVRILQNRFFNNDYYIPNVTCFNKGALCQTVNDYTDDCGRVGNMSKNEVATARWFQNVIGNVYINSPI